MPVVSKEFDPTLWRQSGLRMHPEIRKSLKVEAALAGETMEDTLHRILAREFRRPELLNDPPGGDIRATAK